MSFVIPEYEATLAKFEAARKQAKAFKPAEGFYLVQLDQHLVIPAKDFPKFLEAIQQARKKSRYYSDPPRLTPLASDDITIQPFSRAEYEAYQVAALLNLDREGLRAYMDEQAKNPDPPMTTTFALTPDQEAAKKAFHLFLLDPVEKVFVLSGYSGCGKSTLVRTLLDELPTFYKTLGLINPGAKAPNAVLTATTNKAAENLGHITGYPVRTIHSFLGLRVSTDFRTGVTELVPNRNHTVEDNVLLFIDEASYIDSNLLKTIFQRIGAQTKVIFIGDPAQLTPVKATATPVFEAGFGGAALTQVVRQAEGNPIVDLSTKFRHTVNTGEFFSFKPDGHHIQHLARDAFVEAIELEFTRPDWRYADSKILAWTNKCVVSFNQYVRNLAKGDPHFQVGDYAVCNSFLQVGKGQSIKTDQLVQITRIEEDTVVHGVEGNWMQLDNGTSLVFQPRSLAAKNAAVKHARANDIQNQLWDMEMWADLRGAYASTINKSQGSTYEMVFIDLDDIQRCNSGDQIARMMYVAVSRARTRVIMTGDLA